MTHFQTQRRRLELPPHVSELMKVGLLKRVRRWLTGIFTKGHESCHNPRRICPQSFIIDFVLFVLLFSGSCFEAKCLPWGHCLLHIFGSPPQGSGWYGPSSSCSAVAVPTDTAGSRCVFSRNNGSVRSASWPTREPPAPSFLLRH